MTPPFHSSLVITAVCSGWTEAIPLLAREQTLVVERLEAVSRIFPVPTREINSDNDTVYTFDASLHFGRSLDLS